MVGKRDGHGMDLDRTDWEDLDRTAWDIGTDLDGTMGSRGWMDKEGWPV